jgi:hypothetical protein
LKRRLLALTVLTVGLLPSIPLMSATARGLTQKQMTESCRRELGYGTADPLYGALLHELRRCVNTKRKASVNQDILNRRLARYDQRFWQRYEHGQKILNETQRSLNNRMEDQEHRRISYYHNVPLEDRDIILKKHRRSRRQIVQEAEQRLMRERRAKYLRWQGAIQSCRYFPSTKHSECVWHMLSQ